jgi:hypothetical protein
MAGKVRTSLVCAESVRGRMATRRARVLRRMSGETDG